MGIFLKTGKYEFDMCLQSEIKAIGQGLIYEAKLQNSAWPGRP